MYIAANALPPRGSEMLPFLFLTNMFCFVLSRRAEAVGLLYPLYYCTDVFFCDNTACM